MRRSAHRLKDLLVTAFRLRVDDYSPVALPAPTPMAGRTVTETWSDYIRLKPIKTEPAQVQA
jgi:hypothetical protein